MEVRVLFWAPKFQTPARKLAGVFALGIAFGGRRTELPAAVSALLHGFPTRSPTRNHSAGVQYLNTLAGVRAHACGRTARMQTPMAGPPQATYDAPFRVRDPQPHRQEP
ncbi:hypothetical protein GCM10025795_30870 [Verticiella sediminum]